MTNNNTNESSTMTNQEIVNLARKNGTDVTILHAMVWADHLILKGDYVLCLHDSPNECDTQFFIGKKDK